MDYGNKKSRIFDLEKQVKQTIIDLEKYVFLSIIDLEKIKNLYLCNMRL